MQIYSKAIAAYIAGALIPLFAILGITGDMPFETAIETIIFSLLTAIGTAVTVYFAPKNK